MPEIIAGLSLKNLNPRVWAPASPYHLPNLRAVMVSYAEFHQMPAQGHGHELARHLHAVAVVAVAQVTDHSGRDSEKAGHFLHAELARCDPLGVLQRHGDGLEVHAFLKNRSLAGVGADHRQREHRCVPDANRDSRQS